jgi:hypothetical protein
MVIEDKNIYCIPFFSTMASPPNPDEEALTAAVQSYVRAAHERNIPAIVQLVMDAYTRTTLTPMFGSGGVTDDAKGSLEKILRRCVTTSNLLADPNENINPPEYPPDINLRGDMYTIGDNPPQTLQALSVPGRLLTLFLQNPGKQYSFDTLLARLDVSSAPTMVQALRRIDNILSDSSYVRFTQSSAPPRERTYGIERLSQP